MLSPGRWRARSKTRYAPATAAPVSTAPCRFPHSANNGTISQMRFDGARVSAAQQQHAGGEQRQGEQLGADGDDRPEAGGQEQQQRDRQRSLFRAGAPRVARQQCERPGHCRHLGDLQSAAPERSRAARTRAPRAPDVVPAGRGRRAYGTPSGMPPRSRSHGPARSATGHRRPARSAAPQCRHGERREPAGRARARSGSPRLGRALMALNLVESSGCAVSSDVALLLRRRSCARVIGRARGPTHLPERAGPPRADVRGSSSALPTLCWC